MTSSKPIGLETRCRRQAAHRIANHCGVLQSPIRPQVLQRIQTLEANPKAVGSLKAAGKQEAAAPYTEVNKENSRKQVPNGPWSWALATRVVSS
jgi:hypothetical protein